MNNLLKFIYYLTIIQYIYITYTTHRFCRYKFIAQLSFWITVGWAYYFSTEDSNILYTLIVSQITVSVGKLYETIKKMNYKKNNILFVINNKLYLYIYSIVAHIIGFFLAIYLFYNNLGKITKKNIDLTIILGCIYIIIFVLYQIINRKCYPESGFHLNNIYPAMVLFLFTLFVGKYIYISKQNYKKKLH